MKPEIILSLLFLKAQINKNLLKFRKLKSKKAIENLRNDLDEMRRNFADIVYDNYDDIALAIEKITDKNKNAFNVMAMVGGPYHIRKEASLHVYKCFYGGVEVIFDSYVGRLNLLSEPCGIDNLKILANEMEYV